MTQQGAATSKSSETGCVQRHRAVVTLGDAYDGGGVTWFFLQWEVGIMKPLRVRRDTDGVQRHRAVVTLGGAYDGGGVTRFVAVGGRFTVRRETGCVQHHRTGTGRTAGVPGLRRLRHVGQRCRTGRHSGSTCHSLHRRGRSVNLLRTALFHP